MTLPSQKIISAGQRALQQMADRDTPFIFNDWYVAALKQEVGRQLTKRTLLGRRVVLYRTEAGQPVALDDRCAHRSYPLSEGILDGDTIICGYHGFRYDANGNWCEVPSQAKCPQGIGVRNYPLIEQGPLIWIWLGDDAPDATKLPHQDWMESPNWAWSSGYMPMKGSYVGLHENLIDLTHLSFVHERTFGTPDYARAPFEVDIGEEKFAVLRNVVPTKLPPMWANATGLVETTTAARIARSSFESPGLHLTSVAFYESTLPENDRAEFHIRVAHLPTPETASSTHYFFVVGRDFGLDQEDLQNFIHEQTCEVFSEDKKALALVDDVLRDRDHSFFEVSVASDAAAVAMRRYLKSRARTDVREQESVAAVTMVRSTDA
ncbi:aromatic ring-hydroxylating dioxygenase subunit alpha [Paraburkholderia acidiphila]|uniref:Rieske 2Fe-2S domain-containing protein n=1 Tax=Paraburkholderia acidiphila TaxID=2571747 RepID=A0A7Z2J9M2_9BURK|nr:aromatic ring-hydroxylating dioxygenase subunit alpha [Paraburkholderia acidiphila]QGZ56887.1 Rieske 2Fe-2S domain-containing protein [Paraburkholderia acidiphila]